MSLETRAEQVAWLKENLEQFDDKIQGQITSTLELGDAIPDLVINSLYSQQVKAHADIQAEAERQEKIKADAVACEVAVMNKPLTIGFDGDDGEVNLANIKAYFTKVKSGKVYKWVLKDDANLGICANAIASVKGAALKLAQDKADGKGVKKPTRKRRSASDSIEEWVINTEDDARKQYAFGMYASKYDLERKSIYKEQMKIFHAGETDPRDKSKTLEKDLVKYQYKAVVRTDPIFDCDDAKRCIGAVAWKAGRYGSEWASYQGFKGSVMSQCSKVRAAGSDYCAGCKSKGMNFFDEGQKYKKANISYYNGFKGDGVCVKIEK